MSPRPAWLSWASVTERRLTTLAWMSAIVLLAMGAALGVRNELAFRHDRVSQTAAQADILAASATAALSFDDRSALQQYVHALKANPGIAAAAIYDAQGQRLVAQRLGAAPPPPLRRRPVGTGWADHRVMATRAAAEQGQVLGYVFLQTQPDSLGAVLARHTGVGLLTVMGLLLLVLVSAAAGKLQDRARELADANTRLTDEMAARAQAEEALRQSQKMEALGQLTGGIAHDFNNLLQVIMGALELIRRKAADTARVESWAGNALQAADRGASLTRQLLAFSRTQKLDLRAFVVAELVAGMRDLLLRTLGGDIELVLDLDEARVPVLSDHTQLELAILNLAINARDAMPDGGKLTITTAIVTVEPGHPVLAPDAYVALTVADTGQGMSPEVIGRAFDPFFTTKSVGKGTGLGLSQVYGVARQAGGEARIESLPGQGTKVTVLLRRSAETTETAAPEVGSAPVLAPEVGATVLVVDDDDQVRALLHDTLELLGYTVLEANGGPAALGILQARRPDAMLVDFAMPQMNGAQVADRARRLWPDLPIVFASGHADSAAIKAAVGDDVPILRKPFEMETLARTLSGLIARDVEGAMEA
ncbi:response regulator [Phenylobacterium sp.]|uniref:response regulator n=1 Tax=Phenylobacterium sp. TaxID=1871053 RepID=UPI002DEA569A|nr:response regulator [Phenylobacterium sp.]